MATTIARLQATVGMNTKGVETGAKKSKSILKGLAGDVTKIAGGILGAQVVTGAIRGVTSFAKGAIAAGSDATEMMGKFGVTFGSMTDSLTSDLTQFAAATGRSRYDLQGMAADFGAVLKGMKLSETATAGFSGNLAKLAVDWGSFANMDAATVMEKFRAGITGEYESLKSLGIVINAAAVDQELLTMGIEGGAKAATQAQLVQARYNLILGASSDAMGDAARTSDSWANQTVALKAIWGDFMTDIGLGLTTAFGPLMRSVVGLAGSALPKLGAAIKDDVLPGIATMVERFLGLGDAIAVGMAEGGAAAVGLNVIGTLLGHPLPENWIDTIWNVQDAFDSLATLVSGGVGIQPLIKLNEALMGLGVPVPVINTVIATIRGIGSALETAKSAASTAVSTISGIFETIAGNVENTDSPLEALTGSLMDLGVPVPKVIAIGKAVSGIGDALSTARDVAGTAVSAITTAFSGLSDAVSTGGASGGAGFIMDQLGLSDTSAITGAFATLTDGIDISGIQGIFAGIGDAFQEGGIGAAISTALGSAPDLAGILLPIKTQLISNLFDLGQGLLGTLAGMFPGLAPIIEGGLGPLLTIGQTIWDSMAQVKGALFEGLIDVLPDLLSTIGTAVLAIVPVLLQVVGAIGPIVQALAPLIAELLPQVAGLIQTVLAVVVASLPTVSSLFGTVIEVIASLLPVVEAVLPVVGTIIEGIGPIAQQAFGVIGQVIADVMPVAMGIIQKFSALIQERMPQIQEIISGALTIIQAVWNAVWPALSVVIDTVWGVVETVITTVLDVISGVINTTLALINGDWDTAWTEIQTTVDTLLNGALTIVQTVLTTLSTVFGTTLDTIKTTVTTKFTEIKTSISDKISEFTEVGSDLIQGLIDGVKAKAADVLSAATGVISDAIAGAKALLGIHSPSTVFMDIAENMMLGMVQGLSKSESKVLNNVTKSLDRLIGVFDRLGSLNLGNLPSMGDVGLFGQQYVKIVKALLGAMGEIYEMFGYKWIWTIRKKAKRVNEIFEFMAMDFSRIKIIPIADLEPWGRLLVESIRTATLAILEIEGIFGKEAIKRVANLTKYLVRIMAIAALDLSGIKAIALPDLDAWGAQLVSLVTTLVNAITAVTDTVGMYAFNLASNLVDQLTALFGLIDAANLADIVPAPVSTFADNATAVVDQISLVAGLMVTWLGSITPEWVQILQDVAPLTGLIKQLFEMIGSANLADMIPQDVSTFATRATAYVGQLVLVGSLLAGWLGGIPETWRDTLAVIAPLGGLVKQLFELIGAADLAAMVPQDANTFLANATGYIGQLELVGGLIATWLNSITAEWRGILEDVAPLADLVKKLFDLLGIDLAGIVAPGQTFLPNVMGFLDGLKSAAPLVRDAIQEITGLWADTESMAADAGLAATIKSLFSILDLQKTLDEITTETALSDNQRKLPLLVVIGRMMHDLKLAAPYIKDGLAEIAELFGGALDLSVSIAEQIAKLFRNLADAVKAGVEFTTTDGWDLSALLGMINELDTATTAVGGISLPAIGAGGFTGLPTQLPEGPPASKTSMGSGTAGGGVGIEDRIAQAIQSALSETSLKLELNLVQAEDERKEFAVRLGRLEEMFTEFVVNWEAGG